MRRLQLGKGVCFLAPAMERFTRLKINGAVLNLDRTLGPNLPSSLAWARLARSGSRSHIGKGAPRYRSAVWRSVGEDVAPGVVVRSL